MDGLISGSGQGPAGGGDPVCDTDTASFVADVIEASKEVPVIVDFWAPWCGPCKQLTPMLERLVRAANGSVRMARLNVDENKEIAARIRIQSVPTVFAFKDGQVVDGFIGALPESQIKEFIARLTGGASTAAVDDLLEQSGQLLAKGDFASAAKGYAAILQQDRENPFAIAGLARCQLAGGDARGAEATLELAPPALQSHAEIAGVRAALELAAKPVDEDEIDALFKKIQANVMDHESRLRLAVALNKAGRREEALDHLIAIIEADRHWNDEAARKQLVQFFEAWGPKDEFTFKGRRRLSALLFS